MTNGDPNYYSSLVADCTTGTFDLKYACQPIISVSQLNNNKKGGDDMRYLYEVILVNPKNDACYSGKTVKKTETSALMKIYQESQFHNDVDFDDLKTSCRVLMEWKKEKSLKKAIETIKEAVE